MNTRTWTAALLVAAILIYGGMAWWGVNVWDECRDGGGSWFYCLRIALR